jgi:AcrR family transcriptional regulator
MQGKKRLARKKTAASVATQEPPPRERILAGAFAAFMALGYGRTSMLEIATRARVSKRDLYANFADKSAILAACIETRASRMRLPLALPTPQDKAGLAGTLTRFGLASLREGTQPSSVAVLRLAITDADPEAGKVFHRVAMAANQAALANFLATAQAKGFLAPGDAQSMAGLFLATLWGNTLTRLLLRVTESPSESEMERRASDATRLFLLAFGGERG